MNERIIALDIGDARIGVAVSDASRLIATPIDTIYRVGYGPDVRKVVEICQRYDTTPVSYTHLDVYKRQIMDGSANRLRGRPKTPTAHCVNRRLPTGIARNKNLEDEIP